MGDGSSYGLDRLNGIISKASQSLCHHWHKLDPCRSAGSQMGGQLALNSNIESVARGVGRLMKGVLLEW